MDGTVTLPTITTHDDGSVTVENPITASIAMISPWSVSIPTHVSLWEACNNRAHAADGVYVDAHWVRPTGPYLDDGRNACVQTFLADHDTDWLVFADADVEFSRSDLVHLLYTAQSEGWHVLSGAYCTPLEGDPRNTFTVAYRNHRINGPGAQLVALENSEVVAGVDAIPVDVVGMGFCAISRPILQYMAQFYDPPCPWFFEPIADETHHGEDVGFCLRLRALGVEIGLHRGVRVNHYKTARFNYDGLTLF